MTEEELLRQPETEYMSPAQLEFFRVLLTTQREEAFERLDKSRAELKTLETAPDEADAATIEEERQLLVRQVERNRHLLTKIDKALSWIDSGDYGWCAQTGEAIGLRRLLARPTTDLCIEAKTRQEQREMHVRSAA